VGEKEAKGTGNGDSLETNKVDGANLEKKKKGVCFLGRLMEGGGRGREGGKPEAKTKHSSLESVRYATSGAAKNGERSEKKLPCKTAGKLQNSPHFKNRKKKKRKWGDQ